MKRPTHHNAERPAPHEINGKLSAAKDFVSCGKVALVHGSVIVRDLLELDVLVEDLPELLPRLLDELNPKLYRGARPPTRSYEDTIKGCELYVFGWPSRILGCGMYFKFALKADLLWIVSLHRDRNTRRGGMNHELPE